MSYCWTSWKQFTSGESRFHCARSPSSNSQTVFNKMGFSFLFHFLTIPPTPFFFIRGKQTFQKPNLPKIHLHPERWFSLAQRDIWLNPLTREKRPQKSRRLSRTIERWVLKAPWWHRFCKGQVSVRSIKSRDLNLCPSHTPRDPDDQAIGEDKLVSDLRIRMGCVWLLMTGPDEPWILSGLELHPSSIQALLLWKFFLISSWNFPHC